MSDQSLHDTAIDYTPVGSPKPWRTTEAAIWTASVGVVTGAAWLVADLGYRLLPGPSLFDRLGRADLPESVARFAGLSGLVGLLVGGIGGLMCGRRPACGLVSPGG